MNIFETTNINYFDRTNAESFIGNFNVEDYLKELGETHSNLKVVTLDLDDRFHRGKKFAITMGIKAASYERLLFTDADCKPASDQWISSMSKFFSKKKKIVLLFV